MRCVTAIDRAQSMLAAGQGQYAGGLARWVQCHLGKLPSTFHDGDSACGWNPIRPGHVHQYGGLRLSARIVGGDTHRGFCGYALRARRRHRQREHCQRHTQPCNQLKPQTAAVHASHVHLLQISRRIARCQIAYHPLPKRRRLLYLAQVRWGQPAHYDLP